MYSGTIDCGRLFIAVLSVEIVQQLTICGNGQYFQSSEGICYDLWSKQKLHEASEPIMIDCRKMNFSQKGRQIVR